MPHHGADALGGHTLEHLSQPQICSFKGGAYLGVAMNDHIYKIIELTGTSTKSIEEAINNALKRASETLHGLRWFEMKEVRGDIDHAAVKHWQVTIKVGFTLDA
jgi:flavin-binding protein dodecin